MAGNDDDIIVFSRKFFADARRKAWAKLGSKDREKVLAPAVKGARAWWEGLTAEERSAEMKRRAKVRAKNRKAEAAKPRKQR
jgi:hypothetical protein